MKVISIEIGYRFTKLCVTDYKTNKQKIYKKIMVKTPHNGNSNMTGATEELAGVVKEALKENKVRISKAVFTASSNRIFSTKEIEIPKMKDRDIDSYIKTNIAEYAPIKIDEEHHVEFFKMSESEDSYKMMLLMIKKSSIEEYKKFADGCGLELLAVDYSGNGFYQYAKLINVPGNNVYIKINEHKTMITVMNGTQLVFQRHIFTGIEEIVEYCAERKNVTYEKMLEDMMYDDYLTDMKDNEITAMITNLVNSISKGIDFYASKNTQNPIDNIFICGVGSEIMGLKSTIASILDHEIKNIEKPYIYRSAGRYLTCINSALLPIGYDAVAIKKKQNTGLSEKKQVRLGVGILVLGITMGGALNAKEILEYKEQKELLDAANQTLIQMNDASELYTKYTQYQNTLADYQKIQTVINEDELNLLDIFAYLEDNLPECIAIKAISANDINITFNIEAPEKDMTNVCLKIFRDCEFFSEINIDSIQDDGEGLIQFSITGYRNIPFGQ